MWELLIYSHLSRMKSTHSISLQRAVKKLRFYVKFF